jgi:REP element-mobilizing transposase RayT
MPRKLRVEYPGAIYHVLSQAKGRGNIFETAVDRRDFIKTLAEACGKTGFQMHAYCLLPNHFHLVVETPRANLVAGMHWFLTAYTLHYNRRHKRSGHLFSGRYKALIVDGGAPGYLGTVCDYVHLSPVRAKLLRPGQWLAAYLWSSFGFYLSAPSQRPAWLRVDRLLGEHGIKQDSVAGRRAFEQRLEARRAEARDPAPWRRVRRGWCLGTAKFKTDLLKRLAGKVRTPHAVELERQSMEAKGERIIREELKRLGWRKSELSKRPKGDPAKLAIADRLRRETTLALPWIAARLHAGTWKSLNAQLYRWRKTNDALAKK